MVNWILFDQAGVQNTLVFTHKENYTINQKRFPAKILQKIFYTEDFTKYSVGKLSEKELIGNFIKSENLELRIDEFVELFKQGTVPIKGMYKLIDDLSRKYNLAALINEGAEWAEYKFQVTGLRSKFAYRIISGEIGLKKPDHEFYEYALKKINVKPQDCIFIDDAKKNCIAAEELEIKSIDFKDVEQLKQELNRLNIHY